VDSIADPAPAHENAYAATDVDAVGQPAPRRGIGRWLLGESPYIAMLVLALIGVGADTPIGYWLIIAPVFALISLASGWRHVSTVQGHVRMIGMQVLSWAAVLLAIFALYNDALLNQLNSNAISLAIITILALGTFLAGLHALSWRTCAVGVVLFVAVPVVGWVNQSALLLTIGALAIVAIGGLVWFFTDTASPKV
jgi:hypothetical protein